MLGLIFGIEMKKKLHIAASPLTGTIFAGTVLKDEMTWGANKQDVTIEALVAVAEHAIKFGRPVEITKADGTPEYRITVEKLTPNAELSRAAARR
jgi:hypothetical protein